MAQSEPNKIALAAARLRMKERCAADPVYRRRFVEASRKGQAVIKRMWESGELVLQHSQIAALARGREIRWNTESVREKCSKISSETMRATNLRRAAGEFGGQSERQKRAASATMNRLWTQPEHRRKIQAAMSRTIKAVWNRPGYRDEQRQRISEMHKRLWSDASYREKMAVRPLSNGKVNQRVLFTDRKQREFVLRSGWEKTFAIWLDSIGLDWDYEPLAIDLKNGHRYYPDFWIEQWECFVEVKGREWGLEKIKLAIELGWKIEILRSVKLQALNKLLTAHQ